RTYSFYDTLNRFLIYSGYNVTYLQNVTDVGHLFDTGEDKILKKAKEEHKSPIEIATHYLDHWLAMMDRLRIRRPDLMPRATDHVNEIIDQVQKIIKNGYAYVSHGSVYFDLNKFKDYGKLSKSIPKELVEGIRIAVNPEKKDAKDFALWIKAPELHALKWESPWGMGYPGWHIEDTAIAVKYFGPQYDLHGGGLELAFPHHEAEIAQAETATGKKPFVKYWVHTGTLTINKQKMAKSIGNVVAISDVLDKWSPETLRLWIASTHYRKPLDYNENDLSVASKKVERIRATLEKIREAKPGKKSLLSNKILKLKKDFLKAMEDDMNTPLALTKYFEIISLVNKNIDQDKISKSDLKLAEKTIYELGEFFQIVPEIKKKEIAKEAMDLIKKRNAARIVGNFEVADQLRKELKDKYGIIIEDTPDGVKWKFTD
ncbi:MAG: cysteine--tRNA ligase, partial [Candidatus Aenigmarchaeota archaeon]|nr:cysteine--tRNA ligase [Candidatus Aenigmarchaeota archaeon]